MVFSCLKNNFFVCLFLLIFQTEPHFSRAFILIKHLAFKLIKMTGNPLQSLFLQIYIVYIFFIILCGLFSSTKVSVSFFSLFFC